MLKKKTFVITIIIVFFIIITLLIGFERSSNSPKYQTKFTGYLFNTFMILPDSIKSSILIFSGKNHFQIYLMIIILNFYLKPSSLKSNLNVKKIN